MDHFEYMLSGLAAACMAACVYLGFGSGRAASATTLGIDTGLIAAVITFLALMVAQHPQLFTRNPW